MGYRFDPELAALAASIPGGVGNDADLPAQREAKRLRVLANDPPDYKGVEVTDLTVRRADGGEVALRVSRPAERADALLPCVFAIHGGGFSTGHVDEAAGRDARWVRALGCVVVGVTYRLAPENPYPAAFDDCLAGYQGLVAGAEELGIDKRHIALYGISAGGGLALAVALHAREISEVPPCFQFLAVPMVDDRMDTWSSTRFVDTPVWNRPRAEKSWDRYMGEGVRGSTQVPVYAAPFRAPDLTGLPRTYISVMEFDPLRDEGIALAQRLLQAGVQVELHLFPGTFHGSYRYVEAAITRRELEEQVTVIRDGFRVARNLKDPRADS